MPRNSAIPSPRLTNSLYERLVPSAALVLGAGSLSLVFRSEIAAAVYQWSHSAAFNYCFLVLPVATYLAWDRRQAMMATPLKPAPWLALLAVPAAALWFAAERLGIMEGRQLMAMTLFQVMAAAVLGWRTWRVLAIPLLYLYFAVPIGEFLIPSLIWISVHSATTLLALLGVPNFAHGGMIEIPQMTFLVGDQCSGSNYLISSTAFGVLYATLMYTGRLRRVCFVLFAIALPIVANGIRVAGIIVLGQFVSAKIIELDHTGWGWYFFSFVILVQSLAGLPFRQERRPLSSVPPDSAAPLKPLMIAAALMPVLLLAAIPPLAARQLDQWGAEDLTARVDRLPAIAGCQADPTSASPADRRSIAASAVYRCGSQRFLVALHRFPPRIGAHPIIELLRTAAALTSRDAVSTRTLTVGSGPTAQFWTVASGNVVGKDGVVHGRVIATALRINGRPITGGIAARVDQALSSLRLAPASPATVVVVQSEGPIYAMSEFLDKISTSFTIRCASYDPSVGCQPRTNME